MKTVRAAAAVLALLIGVVESGGVYAEQEHAELSPPERRRRLEYYISIINLAGVAAGYADLKEMKDEAAQLRKSMTSTDEKVKSLVALMKQEGQNAAVDDALRPGDQLKSFDNQSLEKLGKEQSLALLGTFVAKVKGGSRARVSVQREGMLEEFVIRFDERPKDLLSIVQVIGLIPGQEVVAAPAAPAATPPAQSPPPPPPPAPAVPEAAKKVDAPPVPAAEPKPTPAAPVRAPVPGLLAVKDSEKLIRDVFKDDYLKKAPIEKLALARKFLQQGVETKDAGPEAFVLLREARDLASQFGDLPTTLAAIAEMSNRFEVNEAEMKAAALTSATKVAKSTEEFGVIAKAYLSMVESASAAEDYESAERSALAGSQAAKKAKDVAMVSKLEAKIKECGELKIRSEKVRKAKEALLKNPEDPEANLAVGSYQCYSRGDFDAGLPLLAKGSDADLKAVAAKDLAKPGDAVEQAALGDAWWALSEKQNGPTRASSRKRAAFWYAQAVPQLSGLVRIRTEKRVAEVEVESPTNLGIDLLRLVNPKESIGAEWTMNARGLFSPDATPAKIPLAYAPGESEYDLTVFVQPTETWATVEIGLVYGPRQFIIDLDGGPGAAVSGLGQIDRKNSFDNEFAYRDKGRVLSKSGSTVVCSVRASGVTVTVDGKKIVEYKGGYSRITLPPAFYVPNPDALFLATWKTKVIFTKVTLTPVSGKGRLLK